MWEPPDQWVRSQKINQKPFRQGVSLRSVGSSGLKTHPSTPLELGGPEQCGPFLLSPWSRRSRLPGGTGCLVGGGLWDPSWPSPSLSRHPLAILHWHHGVSSRCLLFVQRFLFVSIKKSYRLRFRLAVNAACQCSLAFAFLGVHSPGKGPGAQQHSLEGKKQ